MTIKRVYKNKKLRKEYLDHVFIDLRDRKVVDILRSAYGYPSYLPKDKKSVEKYFYNMANASGLGEHAYDFVHRDLKYEGNSEYPLKSLIKLLKEFKMYNEVQDKLNKIK